MPNFTQMKKFEGDRSSSCVMEGSMEWDRAYCRNFKSTHEFKKETFRVEFPKIIKSSFDCIKYLYEFVSSIKMPKLSERN